MEGGKRCAVLCDEQVILFFDQSEYDIRCEWGEDGLARLAPISDVVIIVDVMSFSTCVTTAVSAGATVYPHKFRDDKAHELARELGAELAKARGAGLYSLSPGSLVTLKPGMKLVLPSRNGAVLSLGTGKTPTFVGCLRNAAAVAKAALGIGRCIAVIAAGERWEPTETLRPAIEDWLGAGAIISALTGSKSPEAELAESAFTSVHDRLQEILTKCSSGKELISKGYAADIDFIAALNIDTIAPRLIEGCFTVNS